MLPTESTASRTPAEMPALEHDALEWLLALLEFPPRTGGRTPGFALTAIAERAERDGEVHPAAAAWLERAAEWEAVGFSPDRYLALCGVVNRLIDIDRIDPMALPWLLGCAEPGTGPDEGRPMRVGRPHGSLLARDWAGIGADEPRRMLASAIIDRYGPPRLRQRRSARTEA